MRDQKRDIISLLQCETPLPVSGRNHNQVQTERYLEELWDVIEADTVYCQTDALVDRPPTPLFVPAKTGIDASTEILSGDLFDFELEVRPILEVLVGKLMEQALLEVSEEEELASVREQQLQYEEIRAADLIEVQRLAERERRYRASLATNIHDMIGAAFATAEIKDGFLEIIPHLPLALQIKLVEVADLTSPPPIKKRDRLNFFGIHVL
ncbi:hypothetical protein Aperf_G00000112014 [Anoplocephala perfoliata]